MQRLHTITNAYERSHPSMPYNELLATCISKFAIEDLQLPGLSDSIAEPFGNSPGTWAAFGDTVAALQTLHRHYKLVILSNVDNRNIAATVGRQLAPATFDAVYTAQDIGAYKPSHAPFAYLFARAKSDLGVDKDSNELLHVARSLIADHVPAKELGLPSVWISRGGDRKGGQGIGGDYAALREKVGFGWRFETLGDFAEEVERQFAIKALAKS